MARIVQLEERLHGERTGLILSAALHGYLSPNDAAKARFLEERGMLANLERLLQGAWRVAVTVFYPTGAHAPDGSDSVARLTDTDMDLSLLSEREAIKSRFSRGSPEAEIAVELAPTEGGVRIPKQRWSAVYQTGLNPQLRIRGIGTIILAGDPRMWASPAPPLQPAISTTDSRSCAMPASRRGATTTTSSWSGFSPHGEGSR